MPYKRQGKKGVRVDGCRSATFAWIYIEVQDCLRSLESLSAFDPAYFAPENGAADLLSKEIRREEMKINQLRKFFSTVKLVEANVRGKADAQELDSSDKSRLFLLLPELAYGVGRKLVPPVFYNTIKICLTGDKIRKVGDFKRFVEFLAAIIAYYKFQEGGGR